PPMRPDRLAVRLAAAAAGLLLLSTGLDVSGSTEAAPPASSEKATAVALATTTNPSAFGKEVLSLINKARATKRKCGSTTYSAAKPLKWNTKLAAAALAHSKDMSVRNYFSHTSKSGRSPYSRIKATGYRYKAAGETLAAGYSTPKAVVNAWLKSKSHCKILMSKSFTQVGVGFYSGGGKYTNYTTADFGKPK
ncbi:MAG: CAP domain-containing protein, partial [Propionicimonas sp.]|nr:CAP domain-containing protein [Propionicimonas sp.]